MRLDVQDADGLAVTLPPQGSRTGGWSVPVSEGSVEPLGGAGAAEEDESEAVRGAVGVGVAEIGVDDEDDGQPAPLVDVPDGGRGPGAVDVGEIDGLVDWLGPVLAGALVGAGEWRTAVLVGGAAAGRPGSAGGMVVSTAR